LIIHSSSFANDQWCSSHGYLAPQCRAHDEWLNHLLYVIYIRSILEGKRAFSKHDRKHPLCAVTNYRAIRKGLGVR
jgi:hypothetical protein